MREILFKAKRVDNGEWIKGYVIRRHGLYFLYDIVNSDTCRQNNYEVDPKTICQYTGLTDKNGKKIWENDIIKAYNTFVLVKYGCYQSDFDSEKTKHIGFYVEWPEENYFRKDLGYWIGEGYTVVGNIFDNPELYEEVPHE